MARKGENIYKRKDGRWEGRYPGIKLPDGRKKYSSVYGRTYREVKEKLLLKKREQLTGEDGGRLPDGFTMGEAVRLWLEERKGGWKESTSATYRSIVEKHILPSLGSLPVKAWDTASSREYFKTLREGSKGKGLSANYIHQIHIILEQILRFLEVKYRCSRLEHPRRVSSVRKHKTVQPPPEADIRKLEEYLHSEAAKGDVTCMGILLSGCSGIRIGELCALQWEDIRFEKGTMHIGRTLQRIRTFRNAVEETDGCSRTGTKITITPPKSLHSDREIPLPDYLLHLLQSRKGNRNGYLIPGKKKEYTEPRTLQYRFRKILDSLGIPVFNFHMLRHIFATNCISHGFDMKTVSELLGHSNVTTTMRIYVHSDMERKKMLMAGYRMTA